MCLEVFPVHFYFPTGENSLGTLLGVPLTHLLSLPWCCGVHGEEEVPSCPAPTFSQFITLLS